MTLSLLPQRPVAERALEAVDELLAFARSRLAKASRTSAEAQRQRLLDKHLAAFTADLVAYFQGFATRALPKVRKDAAELDFNPDSIDWSTEEDLLTAILTEWWAVYGQAAYQDIELYLSLDLPWDLSSPAIKKLLAQIGERVVGINETSRLALAEKVTQALEHGYSIDQLVNGVGADGFTGLVDLVAGWGSDAGRASVIALTETATAMNLATAAGYRASGIVDEVLAYDGEGCGLAEHDDPDYPDGVDGLTFTLDDMEAYPTAHPNCIRAWSAVPVTA